MDVNEQTSSGNCALLWSATQGQTESLRFLLAHQANVNIKDTLGHSALHYARSYHHKDAELLLLAHGAKE